MKKTIITLVVMAAIAASVGGYYYTRPGPEPKVSTAPVSRGDITETVSATGTLDAVTAVTVGSQVGGIIQEIPVDFNSIVKKGDVLLRINPDAINTQIEQAKATLVQRQADLERNKVSLEDSRVKLRRARELFAKKLSTQADLDTAEVAVKSAEASLKSSEASLGAGAGEPEPAGSEPRAHDHQVADRRHHHPARGGRRPDGAGELPVADAVHRGRRPDAR